MKPLRIIHVTTESSKLAGAERLLVDIARMADRSRWSLEFVTVRPDGPVNRALHDAGWPVHALNLERSWELPRAIRELRRIVGEAKPDLVHAHLFHAAVLCTAALREELALVQTRHYTDYARRYGSWYARLLDPYVARKCLALAAVSEAARKELVDVERVAAGKVTTIENGVDVGRFEGLTAERGRGLLGELGVGDGPIVGCLASFHAIKGHLLLLDAFASVAKEHPEAELVLLGDGPERRVLRDEVARRELSRRVHFLGHRDDATELAAGFDLYVQPSLEEGFGLGVVEAMALGLPVVASAVGGMVETVEDRRTGLLVPAGDARSLEFAMREVLRDPGMAQSMGKLGRKRARERYSLGRMLERYDQWYREVLSGAMK